MTEKQVLEISISAEHSENLLTLEENSGELEHESSIIVRLQSP